MLQAILLLLVAIPVTNSHTPIQLPDAPDNDVVQYSGYLHVSDDRHAHYIFTVAESDPNSKPVVVWFASSLGYSLLHQFFFMFGPYIINTSNGSLVRNDNAWSKVTNLLFIDYPVHAGFSYGRERNETNDVYTIRDLTYELLIQFFEEFPDFKANDLYIGGSSGTAQYAPLLALKIKENTTENQINLRGLFIGNALFNLVESFIDLIVQMHSLGLVDERDYQIAQRDCCNGTFDECNFSSATDVEFCGDFISQIISTRRESGLNMYNLIEKCKNDTEIVNITKNNDFSGSITSSAFTINHFIEKSDLECIDETPYSSYLNRVDVRQALNIPDNVRPWDMYRKVPYKNLMLDDIYEVVAEVVDSNLRIFLFGGDLSLTGPMLHSQRFAAKLGYERTSKMTPFFVESDRVAGHHTQYNLIEVVSILTSGQYGSGRNAETLYALQAFLSNGN